jgi:hypothetical protein
MAHAEALHNVTRTPIFLRGERDDLRQTETTECVIQRGRRGFGRVSAPPILAGETPADLDVGREMRVEARLGQANVADKRCDARCFDRGGPAMGCDRAPEAGPAASRVRLCNIARTASRGL